MIFTLLSTPSSFFFPRNNWFFFLLIENAFNDSDKTYFMTLFLFRASRRKPFVSSGTIGSLIDALIYNHCFINWRFFSHISWHNFFRHLNYLFSQCTVVYRAAKNVWLTLLVFFLSPRYPGFLFLLFNTDRRDQLPTSNWTVGTGRWWSEYSKKIYFYFTETMWGL